MHMLTMDVYMRGAYLWRANEQTPNFLEKRRQPVAVEQIYYSWTHSTRERAAALKKRWYKRSLFVFIPNKILQFFGMHIDSAMPTTRQRTKREIASWLHTQASAFHLGIFYVQCAHNSMSTKHQCLHFGPAIWRFHRQSDRVVAFKDGNKSFSRNQIIDIVIYILSV